MLLLNLISRLSLSVFVQLGAGVPSALWVLAGGVAGVSLYALVVRSSPPTGSGRVFLGLFLILAWLPF